MTLDQLIQACIAKKVGNKEFALFFIPPDWSADIGNPTSVVMLGEARGEICSDEHPTAIAAVAQLLERIP